MEQELAQKKREMANIIEQANAAYEARDQAQAQMASLKQQADREHLEFEREWKELGKLIANDKNMKDYMRTMVKSSRDKASPAETREMTQRKNIKMTWDPSMSGYADAVDPEKVASFEEAFERIQAATGIDNLEELVVSFIAAEDMNFTLFNYNNELTADIEKLEDQIAHYKEELVQLSGTGGKKEEVDKVKILETLEEKWNNVDKQATNYELKYQESHQALTHIRTGIESLFKRAGCATKDLPSGTGTGISEGNMMQYLAIVEGRTNELLKVYDAVREGDDFEATRARPGNTATTLQVNKLPSTVEDHSDASEDDDEEDSRPFTVEELKAKSKNKVKKLAQAKGKAKGRT
uniref:ODAD1 central coiled coil region domain-containing protein n=1 Tax=Zooxanthella nutricula TaxID=1333877 RepID=A0A7S2JZD5_9DINO